MPEGAVLAGALGASLRMGTLQAPRSFCGAYQDYVPSCSSLYICPWICPHEIANAKNKTGC